MKTRERLMLMQHGGAAAPAYSISGIITNGTGVVVGATVTLGAYSTTSAGDGTYTISALPAGTSGTLTASKTGVIFSSTISISAMAGNLTGQNIDGVIYLFKDQFTTNQAAPITTPRTCEPGPGTLVVIDLDTTISISSNKLAFAGGGTAGWNRKAVYSPSSIARVNGLAIYGKVVRGAGDQIFSLPGFNKNNTDFNGNNIDIAWYYGNWRNTGVFFSLSGGVEYKFLNIVRSTGYFGLIKGGIFSEWTLKAVSSFGADATLYGCIGAYTDPFTVDDLQIVTLTSLWASDFGIATHYIASPAINETTSSEANATIAMTWAAVTGQVLELSTRQTDTDNRWIIRCDQAGSTIKIIERNAGTETERATAAQTFTNGVSYRVSISQFGNTISTSVDVSAKASYASAAFNNTATIVTTNRAGTNLVTWPYVMSGAALAEITRMAL